MDWLFTTLEDVHPNLYAYWARTGVDSVLYKIKASINKPLTRLEFYRLIAPVVAMLNDGHTGIFIPYEEFVEAGKQGSLRFPLEIDFNQNKNTVTANHSTDVSIQIGDELTAINGVPIDQIKDNLLQYISGESRSFKQNSLRANFSKLLWVVYVFENEFKIDYIPVSGGQAKRTLVSGVCRERLTQILDRTDTAHTSAVYSYSSYPSENIGVIDFRSFSEPDKFLIFLKKTFAQIKAEGITDLIIDIRQNGGGNSMLGDLLLSYLTDKPLNQYSKVEIKSSQQIKKFYRGFLPWHRRFLLWFSEDTLKILMTPVGETVCCEVKPERPKQNALRFKGRVYILIDEGSFSSATSFASAIKDYRLGILIGTETGGLPTSYGDCYLFDLPVTCLGVEVSHKRFVRPSGRDDGRGVLPDHEIKPTSEDRAKGIDTVMEFTKKLIRTERNQ